MPLPLYIVTVIALLTLTACHNNGFQPMDSHTDAVTLKEYPNPQQAYRITMTVDDAPGPFGMIEGSAQYDVTNSDACGQVNPASGTPSRINTNPPLQWQRIADNAYTAVVYVDRMVDEDYYGNGVCTWAFTQARGRLKATGAHEETDFVPVISAKEIEAEKSVIWYFWAGGYPSSRSENFADFGNQDKDYYLPEIRNQLFTVTLSSERIKE
jgi:hypothetical protein